MPETSLELGATKYKSSIMITLTGYTCVRLYHVSPCLTMYIILCGFLIILPSLNLSLRGTLKIPLNGMFLSLYEIFSCVHCISSVSHRHCLLRVIFFLRWEEIVFKQKRGSYVLSNFDGDISCIITEYQVNVADTCKFVAFQNCHVFTGLI